jgi:hypothetical protein
VDELMGPLLRPEPTTAADLMALVQGWRGFGPWVSFKAADMVERLGVRPVAFSFADAMYDSPRKSAEELYRAETGCEPGGLFGDDPASWACGRFAEELDELLAPPRFERALGYQEFETCLCKGGQYLKGRYALGHDISEMKKALDRFDTKTAKRLKDGARKGGL